jgi:hypothetical protein
LVADWIDRIDASPSRITAAELMRWPFLQHIAPSERAKTRAMKAKLAAENGSGQGAPPFFEKEDISACAGRAF